MENCDERRALEDRRERRRLILARKPGRDDASALANLAFEMAVLACGTGDLSAARDALAEGAAAGAAGLLGAAEAAEDGAVAEIRWPDGAARRFPAGDSLNPSDWWRALSCALIVRDADALEVLCEPGNVETLTAPAAGFDDFWLPLCRIAAACVRREPVSEQSLIAVEQLLRTERLTRGDPNVLRAQIAPLLPMLGALSVGEGFDAALAEAMNAHRHLYETDPEPYAPYRAQPLEALGLAALARDRGLPFDARGLPESLLAPAGIPSLDVTLVYAIRYAEQAEDPTGFLDLRGFPRARRRHALVMRGADMIAVYELAGRPGVPHARAEFQLAGGSAPVAARALDPGERLLLAEWHARDAAGAATALEYVDQVLAAIPEGVDAVPAAEFVNTRGRKVYELEPGRFRRDRLQAYREGLLRGGRDAAARSAALTSIEVLKSTVTPLLERLCRARDPQLLAELKPRAGDYALVFADPQTAESAREAYDAQWAAAPRLTALRAEFTRLLVHVAPAGMLATDNELSRHFPGGYRALAPKLNPNRVWVCWKFTRPGETTGGVSYDGLAWCDDHWAWFPKPYRVLSGSAARAP